MHNLFLRLVTPQLTGKTPTSKNDSKQVQQMGKEQVTKRPFERFWAGSQKHSPHFGGQTYIAERGQSDWFGRRWRGWQYEKIRLGVNSVWRWQK